jgi:hypothetical protein
MGGDVRAKYKPDNMLLWRCQLTGRSNKPEMEDFNTSRSEDRIENMDDDIRVNTILMHRDQLKNKEEHYRLAEALMDYFDVSLP